ncbi:chloride channel protein D [Acrasis kona]|uniref:Chloride channel protein D n=1 Tax=Acrasis kona TaxID=1008807 RepID=A0AAW2ZEA0_9EUKA
MFVTSPFIYVEQYRFEVGQVEVKGLEIDEVLCCVIQRIMTTLGTHENFAVIESKTATKTRKALPNCFTFRLSSSTMLSAALSEDQSKNILKPNNNGVTKKKRLSVPPELIICNMIFSPSVAAERMGVSKSTLRRRFAEFDVGQHWPITEQEFEKKRSLLFKENKGGMEDIINQTYCDTKDLDDLTITILQCAFKQHQLK